MGIRSDSKLFKWLEDNPNIEIGTTYDDGELLRVVYKKVGSINDFEFVELSRNYSIREALFEAMNKEK